VGHGSVVWLVRQYYRKTNIVLDKITLVLYIQDYGNRRPRHRTSQDTMTTAPATLPRLSVTVAWLGYGGLLSFLFLTPLSLTSQQLGMFWTTVACICLIVGMIPSTIGHLATI
jgi:hypothetical protein